MDYLIIEHALAEIERRQIRIEDIERTMNYPQQVIILSQVRKIHQSIIDINGKSYLLRLIIDMGNPNELVTVYRTNKIKKYWRES